MSPREPRSIPNPWCWMILAVAMVVAGCDARTPSSASAPASASAPSPRSSTPPPPPSTAPPPANSPSPWTGTPSPSGAAWETVPLPPALDGVHLGVAAWTGQRFLAAGVRDEALVVAVSADGLSWHLQPPLPTPDARDRLGTIQGIAAGPRGVVIVGSVTGVSQTWNAAWYSPDGLAWTVAPEPPGLEADPGRAATVNAVTAGEDGWLAVGEENPTDVECVACWISAITWTSRDGLHWTRSAEGGDLAEAALTGVTAVGPGYVGAGTALDREPRKGADGLATHAVIWTSPDGCSWSRVPDADLFHHASGVNAPVIAASGRRLSAVGWATAGEAGAASLAWWSDDGRAWSRVPAPQPAHGPTGGVVPVRDGFMAVGTRAASGSGACPSGTWASADGTAWSCAAVSTGSVPFIASGIAASPDTAVVIGSGEAEPNPPVILVRLLR
jgi:hypothetical protein